MHTEFSFSEGVSPEAQESILCALTSLVFAVPAKFYVPGESAGTTAYFAKELIDIYAGKPFLSIFFSETPAMLCKIRYLSANT